ncbi:MAG: hypothetical protein QGD94_12835, partial [Planctomycetia bacterium]|nr:hypothetical protein [Planctomycetia bacterium]
MLRTFCLSLSILVLAACAASAQEVQVPGNFRQLNIRQISALGADFSGNVYLSNWYNGNGLPVFTEKFDRNWRHLGTPVNCLLPSGAIKADTKGNVYVLFKNSVVRFKEEGGHWPFTARGKHIGKEGWSNIGVTTLRGKGSLTSFDVDSAGNIYISHTSGAIVTYDPTGKQISEFKLDDVYCIAIDRKDRIFALGAKVTRILKSDGTLIKEFPGLGGKQIFLDKRANMHIFDGKVLRRYNSDGKPLPFAGKAPYLKDNVLGGGKPPAGNI